jgi:hypothetical protein
VTTKTKTAQFGGLADSLVKFDTKQSSSSAVFFLRMCKFVSTYSNSKTGSGML